MQRSAWTAEHVDHLLTLLRDEELSTRDLSTRMSQQFRMRITPSHINMLLRRMRTPNDQLYRQGTPWLHRGAKYTPWRA